MQIYKLNNDKNLHVYEYYDMILYNDDPLRGRIYYDSHDHQSVHCVVARNYAHVFGSRELAIQTQDYLKKNFGLNFIIERFDKNG